MPLSDPQTTQPPGAGVRVHDRGTTRVIEVTGELDIASAAVLEQPLAEGFAHGMEMVVVDFTAVGFMDSTAVQLLVRAAARAQQHGVRLLVIKPDGPAAQVLDMCRLADHLPIVAAADAARDGGAQA
jgi:anti-anti-sigma factor